MNELKNDDLFRTLVGKTFTQIVVDDKSNTHSIWFFDTDNNSYLMTHTQDCCESVVIEEIHGEISCLLDSPILMAEVISSQIDDGNGSQTWTFYKLATIKGYVTIRWYGSSNGYYSEDVNFYLMS